MKRFFLLFASIASLALVVPLATHAEDSSSSGAIASSSSGSTHEPTEDHTTIPAESNGATESTESTESSGATATLLPLAVWVWDKYRAGEMSEKSILEFRRVFPKLQFTIFLRVTGYVSDWQVLDAEFDRILRSLIDDLGKAIASKKYSKEKTDALRILQKWAFYTLESGQTGTEWRNAYVSAFKAAIEEMMKADRTPRAGSVQGRGTSGSGATQTGS